MMHFYFLIFSVVDVSRWQLASGFGIVGGVCTVCPIIFPDSYSSFFCKRIESDFHSQFSVPEKEKGKC